MIVLMPCRAADTGIGTDLSEVLTAVSLSTPVIRKSTVGKIVMLPEKAKKNKNNCEEMAVIFTVSSTLLC